MSASVIIVGAGFSGLAAATHLAQAGLPVTVIEKTPRPGGRCMSFQDPVTHDWIDCGQHLLMGCYSETLDLLERLGTRGELQELPTAVHWRTPDGRCHTLDVGSTASPLRQLIGFLRLSSLKWKDRWAVVRALLAIKPLSENQIADLNAISALQWLQSLRQTPRAVSRFWEPLLVAALNETPERAAADGLAVVARRALLSGPEAAKFLLPRNCLQDLFHPAVEECVQKAGGKVLYKQRVERIALREKGSLEVALAGGQSLRSEFVILAVPPSILATLLQDAGEEMNSLRRQAMNLSCSPIITTYLWLRKTLFKESMMGLLDGPLHWIFSKPFPIDERSLGQRLGVVSSASTEWSDWKPEAIKQETMQQLARYFSDFSPEAVMHCRVVHQREATVSLRPGSAADRPGAKTAWPNLLLAGDWTATGLPATIESAVVSGRRCAEQILELVRN